MYLIRIIVSFSIQTNLEGSANGTYIVSIHPVLNIKLGDKETLIPK